jgi:hypothetical protein
MKTLRDEFAMAALSAYIHYDGIPEGAPDELWDKATATRAYAMADAMLAARGEDKPKDEGWIKWKNQGRLFQVSFKLKDGGFAVLPSTMSDEIVAYRIEEPKP